MLSGWVHTRLLISKYNIRKAAVLRSLHIYFDCSSAVLDCLFTSTLGCFARKYSARQWYILRTGSPSLKALLN